MTENDYLKEMVKIAEPFTKRSKRDAKNKRHDRIENNEIKAMIRCRHEFRATDEKIAEAFQRDVRQVAKRLERVEQGLGLKAVTEKEINEHIQEVKNLLKNWAAEMEPLALLHKRIDFDYENEGEPLFIYLLKHCPSIKKDWQIFSDKRSEYKEALQALEGDVRKEAPVEATDKFSSLAVRFSVFVALEVDLPRYEKNQLHLMVVKDDDSISIAEGNAEILELCQQKHQELVEHFSQTPDVQQTVGIIQQLMTLEDCLRKKVDAAILSKEYARYSCVICHPLLSATVR